MTYRTTYNLVSLVWHPNSSERMHVGLWMNDGERVMFDYNPVRVELAGKLMDAGEWRMVKAMLQELKAAVSPRQQTSNHHLASEWGGDTMSYLQRYATNLLQVEASVPVALDLTPENFHKMCERYLGISRTPAIPRRAKMERRIKEFMASQLESYTTLNAQLDSGDLNGLLFPVIVPSLGINEIPFVCEIVDFESRIDAVSHKIGDMLNLKEAFEANHYKSATYFAIGNEPSKKDHAVHQVWNTLRESKWINLVSENEKDQIVTYAKEHGVRPWIQQERKKSDR